MNTQNLDTKEVKTWCPGCPNFSVLQSIKTALAELVNEGKLDIKNAVMVTGIGCNAKIFDYVNINGFYGLHGRSMPTALGISLANPNLAVMAFAGDGDTYAEGMEHLVHNSRFNANIKMFVQNNQAFSLTTGQASPVSEEGFVDPVNISGVKEKPLNPIELALASGATFVARGYAMEPTHLKDLMKAAILHKGFAFVDILMACLIYHNQTSYFKNIYKLGPGHDTSDLQTAKKAAREWDYCYNKEQKIPIGIFYQTEERPVLSSKWPNFTTAWKDVSRKINWEKGIKEFQ
jgi:2-oxoglutarate/2-oxoacid ferredoxin oxidoreductase subunit beta